jgi:hypothetical protein
MNTMVPPSVGPRGGTALRRSIFKRYLNVTAAVVNSESSSPTSTVLQSSSKTLGLAGVLHNSVVKLAVAGVVIIALKLQTAGVGLVSKPWPKMVISVPPTTGPQGGSTFDIVGNERNVNFALREKVSLLLVMATDTSPGS